MYKKIPAVSYVFAGVLLCLSVAPAGAGLIPEGASNAGSSSTPDTESLLAGNLAALPLRSTEALQQISLTGQNSVLLSSGSNLGGDQFFVTFGDGSATSVRLLANRFLTRGTILQPLGTLDTPWNRADNPQLLFDELADNSAASLDPAMLLKVNAAARSLSAGSQYVIETFTLNSAPFFIGGGFAGLWSLLAVAKGIRNRRSGTRKRVRTTTSRSRSIV